MTKQPPFRALRRDADRFLLSVESRYVTSCCCTSGFFTDGADELRLTVLVPAHEGLGHDGLAVGLPQSWHEGVLGAAAQQVPIGRVSFCVSIRVCTCVRACVGATFVGLFVVFGRRLFLPLHIRYAFCCCRCCTVRSVSKLQTNRRYDTKYRQYIVVCHLMFVLVLALVRVLGLVLGLVRELFVVK